MNECPNEGQPEKWARKVKIADRDLMQREGAWWRMETKSLGHIQKAVQKVGQNKSHIPVISHRGFWVGGAPKLHIL